MSGFFLVILLVLAVLATAVCMWLTAAFDAWLLARKERRYRQAWLREWHGYKQRHPHAKQREYVKEHREDRPINMPVQHRRSYAPAFLAATFVCLALCVVLFWNAFLAWNPTDDRAAFTILCWFTGIVAVGLMVWFCLIVQESVLPGYARNDPNHIPPVPTLKIED